MGGGRGGAEMRGQEVETNKAISRAVINWGYEFSPSNVLFHLTEYGAGAQPSAMLK